MSTAVWAESSEQPDRLQWWREARFGLFVHWGPVSLKGTEIGWSRGGERRGRTGRGSIPAEVYDNLYKEFNPGDFDAKEWIDIAQRAGMKYLVFTSKHHDGFSMFDSALTDYKITNSPFKRDVVAELAEACHEAGFGLGYYYSPPDWYHPDYRTDRHDQYIAFLHGQLREICTKYGKIDIIWFDGLGGTKDTWDSERLIAMIRELQPHVIINNRAGLPEDHDTPEQHVGAFQRDRPWETCMTICRQWAWRPDDKMKSLKECLGVLVTCAGGDGNLLFNVGPMPTGAIEPRQVERLFEMGAWLDQYGETIYGTRGGPFMPGYWGASTCRDNTAYVHILNWEAATPELVLPAIPAKILSHRVLTGGSATVSQSDDGIVIEVPEAARIEPDTIVALELDCRAFDLEPVSVPSHSVAAGMKATASNVYQNSSHFVAGKAFDDNDGTRWATDSGTHEAWLQVELDEPATVGEVVIKEAYSGRVKEFVIEARKGDEWKALHKGTTLGEHFHATIDPVAADAFRLNILRAIEGPTIWEFQLIPPKE